MIYFSHEINIAWLLAIRFDPSKFIKEKKYSSVCNSEVHSAGMEILILSHLV
ncbi:hypothetical protein LLB_2111 [Legionella longbeachae D-4968]|nr:hypothetical protein LLB_2111 [Legionella longbeachae D-4968]